MIRGFYHEPEKGKTCKIISPSGLLHKRFGDNKDINILMHVPHERPHLP